MLPLGLRLAAALRAHPVRWTLDSDWDVLAERNIRSDSAALVGHGYVEADHVLGFFACEQQQGCFPQCVAQRQPVPFRKLPKRSDQSWIKAGRDHLIQSTRLTSPFGTFDQVPWAVDTHDFPFHVCPVACSQARTSARSAGHPEMGLSQSDRLCESLNNRSQMLDSAIPTTVY